MAVQLIPDTWGSLSPLVLPEVYYPLFSPSQPFHLRLYNHGQGQQRMDKPALAQLLHENIPWIRHEHFPGS